MSAGRHQLVALLSLALFSFAQPVQKRRGLLAIAPAPVILGNDGLVPQEPLPAVQPATSSFAQVLPTLVAATVTETLVVTQYVTATVELLSVTTATQTQIQSVLATETRTVEEVKTITQTALPSPTPKVEWSAPTRISNIVADFAVSNFAWGSTLASIIPAAPTTAFGPLPTGKEKLVLPSAAMSKGDVLAVMFPAGSANPAAEPQGGIGFYASPLDLSKANNVSLSYSVLFPHDFDFVKGGKLPGMYGGHGGCSGGASADDCFSTRLMWRQEGAGELYLYASKGDQSKALCSTPPLTYCDTKFGSSIGRGAFSFARGNWTDVRQDIWLNTPGKADGGFNIWINGKLALTSKSVIYRGGSKAAHSSTSKSVRPTATKSRTSSVSSATSTKGALRGLGSALLGGLAGRSFNEVAEAITTSAATPTSTVPDDGGLLGGLLGQEADALGGAATALVGGALSALPSGVLSTSAAVSKASTSTSSSSSPLSTSRIALDPLIAGDSSVNHVLVTKKTIAFQGIMFDAFFGGRADDGYATPVDQTAYFASVGLVVNS